jgi:hypothetical protein
VRGKREQSVYVMEGWVKAHGSAEGRSGVDLRTPLVEVPATPAVVVMRTSAAEVAMFVERGQVRLAERGAKGTTGPSLILNAGQLYTRKAGAARSVTSGGLQAFVKEMPRPYRDSLPLRAERFAGRELKVSNAPEFGYADVQAWLQAEPAVRRPLVRRWRAKARDDEFRATLISNLRAHPEWDPVLFPEKYLPKPASAPDAASAAAQRWRP